VERVGMANALCRAKAGYAELVWRRLPSN
jgi:hypothetical protein